ncbi:MAG TPA: hypothetical protein VGQ83_00015 [Polyangia bacterium]|jgi:hypothetical protein
MSLRTRILALLLVCCAAAASGCRRSKTPPAALHAPGSGVPAFVLEPAAVTYERDNRNRWLQARVTVKNPSPQPVRVQWAELKAEAHGPLAGPTWHGDVVPELGPGESVTAPVSWYYPGGEHPLPQAVRIRYAPTGFAQELPVTLLPTSGFTFRFSLPATAVNVANPPPMPGQSWEVRVPLEIRNPTAGPLLFIPFWFEAQAGDQRVRHAGNSPSLLDSILRLAPGESVRGALLWRLRGSGPAPSEVRVTFPSPERPELDETIDVKPPAP